MYYKVASVDAMVIYLGEVISEEVSDRVLALYQQLKSSSLLGIIELIPSYTTLYLQFDLFVHTHKTLFLQIEALALEIDFSATVSGREITIPAYFDPSVGLDLERVAALHKMEIEELVAIYTQESYRVYTVGFAPGYAYMGSVDQQIATPRLATPRARIPQGSVAMANRQCAVYPQASPGGWNILGRTYVQMFDSSIEGFSCFRAGDRVRFVSISREEFVAKGGRL